MSKPYSILMQKVKESSSLKDSLTDFGMVCMGISLPDMEIKDLPSRNWSDENGEDTYIPPTLPLKPYNITIRIAYKGKPNTAWDKMDFLLDYLTGKDGSGVETKLFVPHDGIGRACRLFKIGKPTLTKGNLDDIMEFELTMKVDNPLSRVTPVKGIGETITGLTEKVL